MQICAGLKYMYENTNPNLEVSFITYASSPQLPPGNGHRMCFCGWYPADYWETQAGIDKVRTFINSGLFDVSMFGFCGELAGSGDKSAYINTYLSVMNMLEGEFPNTKFIYQTGHADGYPAYSLLRQNNNMIRQFCVENKKILYDFADIENWDPDGNFYPNNTVECSWCESYYQAHPIPNLLTPCNGGYLTCCPHTHGYNCYIKAKAYWWMLAKIAGWENEQIIDKAKIQINLKVE